MALWEFFLIPLAGILFSFVFIGGPYFGSPALRSIDTAITILLIWLGVASILNFLLVHLRSGGNRLFYIPAIVLLVAVYLLQRRRRQAAEATVPAAD